MCCSSESVLNEKEEGQNNARNESKLSTILGASWTRLNRTQRRQPDTRSQRASGHNKREQLPQTNAEKLPRAAPHSVPKMNAIKTSRKTRRAGSNQRTTPEIPPQQEHYTHPRMKNRRQLQRMNADALFLFTSNYATTNHTVSALDRETSSTSRTLRFNPPSKLHLLHASRKTQRQGEQRRTKKGGLPIRCRPQQNRILTNQLSSKIAMQRSPTPSPGSNWERKPD